MTLLLACGRNVHTNDVHTNVSSNLVGDERTIPSVKVKIKKRLLLDS